MSSELLFTMDPGDNTALVFWGDGTQPRSSYFYALKAKETKLSIAARQQILTSAIEKDLKTLSRLYPYAVWKFKFIIEGVDFRGSSAKSQAAAGRGDLSRLAYLVGGMVNVFQSVFPAGEVDIVTAIKWKGNLPDTIVEKEVERYIKEPPLNVHMACAIGIGMNYFGKL